MGTLVWFDPRSLAQGASNAWAVAFEKNLASLDACESTGSVLKWLLDATPRDRFPFVTVTWLRNKHMPIVSTFPREWGMEYLHEHYEDCDPILWLAAMQSEWFSFDAATAAAIHRGGRKSQGRKIMGAASAHGLADGFCVPWFGPLGDRATLAMAGPKGCMDLSEEDKNRLIALSRAAMYAFARLGDNRMVPANAVSLSERECQCLNWVGAGKSSDDIGALLQISPKTVDFHISRAVVKLNAANRVNAFAKAVALGLVALPF
jgi:DNA-binding CsgD family transcriptional regulator